MTEANGWILLILGFFLALSAVLTKVRFAWERVIVLTACMLMLAGGTVVVLARYQQ